jgi:crotonobetainyl-CoA:carnitine CoA-transferase CaiB-like acyl-CoA transferase
MTKTLLPLEGLRVLDFSRHLPGPWCAQVLGDMGAEVIKIEQRGTGDQSRYNPPRYVRDSVYFHSVNAGKKSIALDLTKPQSREIARRLLASADVVVESFRTGGADTLGVGYEDARAGNAGVIYCTISGFGRTGPYAKSPGHDLAIQAMTGLLGIDAEPGATPPNPAFHAADYAGAAMGVIGILGALQRRNKTGEGCYLDLGMYDSLMDMLQIGLAGALGRQAGAADQRTLEAWGGNPRYRNYPTKDGKAVTVCLLEAKLWKQFCRVIGRNDLVHEGEKLEERLTSHAERVDMYRDAIAAYCLSKTRDEIVAEMQVHAIPITPVLTPDEAVASELAIARDVVGGPAVHPTEGSIRMLTSPFRRAGLAREREAGPGLGEHTQETLSQLGFDAAAIESFKAAGVI